MNPANLLTIGADPELFICKGNELINAYGLIEGTKGDPNEVDDGAVQVDGIALEFNIKPCYGKDTFSYRIGKVMRQLSSMVGDEYEFMTDSSVEFDDAWRNKQDFNSLVMGCSPEFSAWNGGNIIDPPDDELNMRSVGGHIHAGFKRTDDPFSEEHLNKCVTFARLLDHELGVYSVLWDKDQERRKMYGKPGSFRPKEYGIEYRTLSNKWIFEKALIDFVYDGVQRAMQRYQDGDEAHTVPDYIEEIIEEGLTDHPFFESNELAKGLKDYAV